MVTFAERIEVETKRRENETKGLECCMPAGVGCPCIACEESEEYMGGIDDGVAGE